MAQAGDTICPECGGAASATPAGIPPMMIHEAWCGQSPQEWHASLEDALGIPPEMRRA
jgi:hypothetical protein